MFRRRVINECLNTQLETQAKPALFRNTMVLSAGIAAASRTMVVPMPPNPGNATKRRILAIEADTGMISSRESNLIDGTCIGNAAGDCDKPEFPGESNPSV
jgi:hypothetical protein